MSFEEQSKKANILGVRKERKQRGNKRSMLMRGGGKEGRGKGERNKER